MLWVAGRKAQANRHRKASDTASEDRLLEHQLGAVPHRDRRTLSPTEVSPDILCLQETKVIDGDFPTAPFRALGYPHVILHGQRMHHGVAIISKVPVVEDDLPGLAGKP